MAADTASSPLALALRLNADRAAAPSVATAPGAPVRLSPLPPLGAPAPAPVLPDAAAAVPAAARDRVRGRVGRVDLLVFRLGRELFALPVGDVEEAVEVDAIVPLPGSAPDALGMAELRGRLVPVVSPRRLLGAGGTRPGAILVLRDGARRVGVAVDDVEDVLTLDCAALRPAPEADGLLAGIGRRDDALVAVLDPDALLAACLTGAPRPPEPSA